MVANGTKASRHLSNTSSMKGMVCKKKKRKAIKHTLTLSGGDYCTYLHVMVLSTKLPPPPRFLTSKKKKHPQAQQTHLSAPLQQAGIVIGEGAVVSRQSRTDFATVANAQLRKAEEGLKEAGGAQAEEASAGS